MGLHLKVITKQEFNNLKLPTLFYNENTNKNFGIICNQFCIFKLGWDSEKVQPLLINLKENIYAIGIDLEFALINSLERAVKYQTHLEYFYYTTYLNGEFAFVATELSLLKIQLDNFEVVRYLDLPDTFKCLTFEGELALVTCLNGETVNINME